MDYSLWKVVTCQTAAHIPHDATFDFEVIKETDYRITESAYFRNPTFGLGKILPTLRLPGAKFLA